MKKILFTCFIYITLAIQPSQASDKNWVCDDDSWDNSACWDSAEQPEGGDDVYLSNSDLVDRIVSYSNNSVLELELNSLTVDNTGDGSITLIQAQDTLASSEEYIGYDGSGFFTQTGGENIVDDLYLGYTETGDGTYNLSSGSLSANNEIIGRLGNGTFNQTGGTNTANNIRIATAHYFSEGGTATGIYYLSGGSLLVNDMSLAGYDINGVFNQTGGIVEVSNSLDFALGSGASGTYNLSEGSLKVGTYLGLGRGDQTDETGVFNQTGGKVITNSVHSRQYGFTYNLDGGQLSTNTINFQGSLFKHSGGKNIVSDTLMLDSYGLSGSHYDFIDGTLNAGDVEISGSSFSQTGGSSVISGELTIVESYDVEGQLGEYSLAGGMLDVSSIMVDNDNIFNFDGGLLKVDRFTGNLVNNGGTLAPGGSPGVTNINGSYTQTTEGTFEVEIGGHTQGDEYDWLNITGAATLAGTLDVSLLASDTDIFTLGEGDVFDILFAESITGEFDQLVLTALDVGLTWGVSYITEIAGEPDLVRLTINDNQLPAADAGFNQVVDEGMVVDLDGSVSSDVDGTIDGYSWKQTAGTAVVLNDADTATPSFVAPAVYADTVLKFSLQVTDDSGETDEVTVEVTVTDVLVVDAGADQQTTEGNIVRLNGLSSLRLNRPGISHNIVSYMWEQIEGPEVFLDDSSRAKPSFITPTVDVAQLLVFKLTVTDSNGLQDSDTTFVNVHDELLTSIAPPLDIQLPVLVVRSGDFYQFDTAFMNDVQWSQINGPAVTLSDPNIATPAFIAPDVTTDSTATFEVRSTNIDGLVVRSVVNVNILESISVNLVPTANAGNEQVVTEGDTVNLDATASVSNDDENIRYYWQQTGGPIVLLSSIIESQPSFVAPAISAADDGIVLTFELVITDESGLVDRQSVTVIILNNGSISDFADDVIAVISNSGKQIGIEEIDGGSLVSLKVIDPDTIADEINRPESLPYGLIDFSLRVEPGSTVEVNFILPEATSKNVTWWKYVNRSGWIDFSANTTLNAARDKLTITLTDNGIGDDDPTLGVIRDPGGLVQIPDPIPTPPVEESPASSGGSGGGSFSPLLIALLLLINYARIMVRSRATNRVSKLCH